jgi:hypothetical protein
MSLIRVEMPKGVEEGSTSLSPQSPKVSAVASPPISRTGAIMLGYGVMTAKAVFNTATQEIRAGGNEALATSIGNVSKAIGIGVAAYYTGGLSLIPLAVSSGSTFYAREKNNQRVNRAREYEASMRGARVSYQQGGGYE